MADLLVRAASLIAIIALGLVARRLGWVRESDFGTLSTIVLRITLPCALITSFNSFEVGPERLVIVAAGFVAMAIPQFIAFALEARRGRRGQALAVLNTAGLNIGLFAIPYLSAFLGPEAILVASLFDVGNALACIGLAYAWSMSLASQGEGRHLRRAARAVFSSPLFLTYLCLMAMRLLDLTLPDPVIVFTSTVGAANTFLAMFMIGVGLNLTWDSTRYATASRLLAYRYATFALIGVALWLWLPVPRADKVVMVMLLGAPIAAMMSGFTAEARLDVRTATLVASVSVVVAIVAIPALLALLG